jgi:hypothetical protein
MLKVGYSSVDGDRNIQTLAQTSSETRKPVRVVRGFKLRSKYAPSEGLVEDVVPLPPSLMLVYSDIAMMGCMWWKR